MKKYGAAGEWQLCGCRTDHCFRLAELTAQCCWVSPKALALAGTDHQPFRSAGLRKAQSYHMHEKSLWFFAEDLMAISGFDTPLIQQSEVQNSRKSKAD